MCLFYGKREALSCWGRWRGVPVISIWSMTEKKKDLEWARICRPRFACVCRGWRVLWNLWWEIMYHQIHRTYITATFLSLYVFLSVCSVWSFFLSKENFNDPFVKLDTVLPKSIFWQDMCGWKEGKEHRINKHSRRKGVNFMTDGFQCVCVPASFGTSYNCYGFKHPSTCYSVAPQCSALQF